MSEQFNDYPEASADGPVMGTNKLLRAFSRWWIIALFILLGASAGFYYASIQRAQYEFRAVFEITGTEQKLVGDEVEQDKRGLLQIVNTVSNKLVGPTNLHLAASKKEVQQLVNVIPPKRSLKPKYMRSEDEENFFSADSVSVNQLGTMIASWVSIRNRPGTALIDVSVTHPNQLVARTLANALLESYIETEEKRKSGGSETAYELLRQEAEDSSLKLEGLQRALKIYEKPVVLSKQLNAQSQSLAELKARYKPKHPKMIQAESVTADLYERFRREARYVTNSELEGAYWQDLIKELASLDVQMQVVGDHGDRAKEEWLTIVQNALASRVSLLQTRISNQTELFTTLNSRLSEIDIAEGGASSDLRIAESAALVGGGEIGPAQPTMLGGVAGGFVGFILAFLLAFVDYKIYDVRSAEEATSLSCLAAFPYSRGFDSSKGWSSVLIQNGNDPTAESVRNLRASIMLLGKRELSKVIMLTSAAPSEGKTTVASELATSFALNREKVILLDLDLRKPRMQQMFPQLKDASGMSELLSGQKDLDDVIQQSEIENLRVIGAGKRPPNPAELLLDDELESLIVELTARFDRVIIDTPPVLPVSDARLLARHVQRVVMVVRAGKTPVGAVLRAQKLLFASDAPMAGVVINGLKKRRKSGSYYGYKGYGEYGSKGSYGYYGD